MIFRDKKPHPSGRSKREDETLGPAGLVIAPTPVPTSGSALHRHLSQLLEKKPSTGELFPELDGVRGLAVLLVLASHTNLFHLRGTGAVGVWLFFVLSSFLLTRIMRRRLPGSLGVRELCMYIVRRIARVIPTYYVVLAIVTLVDAKPLDWFLRHCVFLLADGHFWSIPQEELFYVFLPLLIAPLYLLDRFLKVPAVVSALILMGLGIKLGFPFFLLPANGSYSSFYLSIFLTGFFLAHLWEAGWFQGLVRSDRIRPVANALGVFALGSFALASPEVLAAIKRATGASFEPAYWGWTYSQRFAVVSAILLVTSLTPGAWTHRLFSSFSFRLLGVLSFGIYLVHYRILGALVHSGWFSNAPLLFLTTLACSIVAALLLELVIEGPAMRIGKALNQKIAKPHP